MLRPVRMTLVNILLLKEDEAAVLRTLGQAECLHVENARLAKGAGALSAVDTRSAVTALDDIRSRIAAAIRTIELEDADGDETSVRVSPRDIAATIEAEFAPVEKEIKALADRISEGEHAREKADIASWTLAGIEHAGGDIRAVAHARYVAIDLGAVPRASFPKLRESLTLAGHKIFQIGSLGGRTFVCAVTEPGRKQELADGLDAGRFERVTLGPDILSNGRSAASISEEAMWQVREEITEAGLALAALSEKRGAKVRQWRREADVNSRLLLAMEGFLEGSYTCLVTGWVPSEKVAALPGALAGACKGPTQVYPVAVEAHGHGGEHGGAMEPPTKLANWAFVRPFEQLVTFYGYPAYDGIDPTSFIAFTFAILFGAMFGDAGQGAILALAGLATWYWSKKGSVLRDAGAILAWCGTTSVIFGFIYGSVFGFEFEEWRVFGHELRTLPPLKDPASFLAAGVIVGVIVINIGLFINLAQRLWARRFKDAVFGEWGLSTLLFYWGVVVLFYLSFTGRGAYLTGPVVAWVLGPPLLATTFGAELYDLVTRTKGEHELVGLIVRPMELMMGSLSNTMSFMRVSAFAMNHAALMGTVFIFAEMFSGTDPGAVGKSVWASDVIIGNIMVMCLEGIMVFVQVLRLHYYEFFSKFFHHQGRPFEPLTLRVQRSGV